MKISPRTFSLVLTIAALGGILVGATWPSDSPFHERKEVAGLAVVFGAEPEPALTDEIQMLVWRVSTLSDRVAYDQMTDAEVTVSFGGETFGPFEVRPVRGTPGQYQTRHIFTEVGEYGSVLSFRKGEESETHSVDFAFRIGDRADMEIPRRRGGR